MRPLFLFSLVSQCQDVWEQGRPRALTAPEADECDESPLAALRKSKTVDVDQERWMFGVYMCLHVCSVA